MSEEQNVDTKSSRLTCPKCGSYASFYFIVVECLIPKQSDGVTGHFHVGAITSNAYAGFTCDADTFVGEDNKPNGDHKILLRFRCDTCGVSPLMEMKYSETKVTTMKWIED